MKIHIFGASGSGVTTLGRKLAETLSFPYFDSDDFFHEPSDPPFTVTRNPELRNEMLTNALNPLEHWVLGGSMYAWGCTPAFDLVAFLWIPQDVRIERLKSREYQRYGNIIFTNPERNRLYLEFIEWAKGYDNGSVNASSRTLAAHENWMKRLLCPILEIREDTTVQERIELILKRINELGLSNFSNQLEHCEA